MRRTRIGCSLICHEKRGQRVHVSRSDALTHEVAAGAHLVAHQLALVVLLALVEAADEAVCCRAAEREIIGEWLSSRTGVRAARGRRMGGVGRVARLALL